MHKFESIIEKSLVIYEAAKICLKNVERLYVHFNTNSVFLIADQEQIKILPIWIKHENFECVESFANPSIQFDVHDEFTGKSEWKTIEYSEVKNIIETINLPMFYQNMQIHIEDDQNRSSLTSDEFCYQTTSIICDYFKEAAFCEIHIKENTIMWFVLINQLDQNKKVNYMIENINFLKEIYYFQKYGKPYCDAEMEVTLSDSDENNIHFI